LLGKVSVIAAFLKETFRKREMPFYTESHAAVYEKREKVISAQPPRETAPRYSFCLVYDKAFLIAATRATLHKRAFANRLQTALGKAQRLRNRNRKSVRAVGRGAITEQVTFWLVCRARCCWAAKSSWFSCVIWVSSF